MPLTSIKNTWDVLVLFLIPVGGGIPAGVLLAKTRGLPWQMMLALYFLSDVILACVFEPFMILVALAAKKYQRIKNIVDRISEATARTIEKYGVRPGPFSLIAIAFGVDPMTGRTAAFAAGHGFIAGWFLAILGDMIYFTVLMISTLWLNNILGDGTLTAIIVMAGMFFVPVLWHKAKALFKK